MQRVLTSVTLLGLLVATAAAFAITEHLKQIKSPLSGVEVSKVLSPVCRCATSEATIGVRLRHPDHVTVTIVDSAHRTVSTVASDVFVPAHTRHVVPWNGSANTGGIAPDGVYYPWVHLGHARWTYRFTNRITLDTEPPHVLSAGVAKTALFAGRGRSVAIHYTFSEKAHAVVFLDGRPITVGRVTRPTDKIKWTGKRDRTPLPAGTYVLSVGALDLAGNKTPADERKQVTVDVRYVELSPGRITVRRGRRLTVHVETAAKRYTWRLGKRHGSRRGKKTLRVIAPSTPGAYRLVVEENGHTATAVVRVRAK